MGHIKLSLNYGFKGKIGARITQLRKAKKLSQQKFSYEADIERTFLTHIEKGRKNISVGTLERIISLVQLKVNLRLQSS